MKLFDSKIRKKRIFEPINPESVTLYVCGPTVYGDIHIGNARPLVVFDLLARLLRHQYAELTYVRNITDIDDKIMQRAQDEGVTTEELVQKTSQKFQQDWQELGILPVDHEPRATEYLDEMIAMIERLISLDHAYVSGGHVLFSSASFAGYGELSGRTLDEQIAGARVEVADYKRDGRDFVLWKPSEESQVGWSSPWGRGRPGWHIECSAMSKNLLGADFDIHGGGYDLLFPHHENERAQSCCAHPGSSFARHWLHNGMVMVEGEKMSKSLGNFITLRALLDLYPGEAIRFLLLSSHYRKPLDYQQEKMQQVLRTLQGLYQRLADAGLDPQEKEQIPLDADFLSALNDDLNTPLALSRLSALARQDVRQLRRCGQFLGFFARSLAEVCPEDEVDSDPEITAKVTMREAARKAKDFATADAIRDELLALGIEILDTPEGARWRKKK